MGPKQFIVLIDDSQQPGRTGPQWKIPEGTWFRFFCLHAGSEARSDRLILRKLFVVFRYASGHVCAWNRRGYQGDFFELGELGY